MAIIQCENMHYYDESRDKKCPYCAKIENSLFEAQSDFNEQMTSYYDINISDDVRLTETYGEFVEEYDRTIGIFFDEECNQLTTGWLVCIEGVVKGKSHVIHSGRNFAGRTEDMDIVLSDDMNISRQNHFSIVYDPKDNNFYILPDSGIVYLNNTAVSGQKLLNDGDEIAVGNSRYIFIPFCKEGRVWK